MFPTSVILQAFLLHLFYLAKLFYKRCADEEYPGMPNFLHRYKTMNTSYNQMHRFDVLFYVLNDFLHFWLFCWRICSFSLSSQVCIL